MAVLMTQTMAEGVAPEILDVVTEEMDVTNDPPTGLIVHVHYAKGGRTEVVDVWESQAGIRDVRWAAADARDGEGRQPAGDVGSVAG